jgi:hypothetical protein
VRRHVLFAVAIVASAGAWMGPLALVGRLGSWWYLLGCLVTVPACEMCWWAHDAIEKRYDDEQ